MKSNTNQKTIISVVKQVIIQLEQTRDIDHSQIYEYIEREVDTLNEIISVQKRGDLQKYLQEIYLLIKNTKDDEKEQQSISKT